MAVGGHRAVEVERERLARRQQRMASSRHSPANGSSPPARIAGCAASTCSSSVVPERGKPTTNSGCGTSLAARGARQPREGVAREEALEPLEELLDRGGLVAQAARLRGELAACPRRSPARPRRDGPRGLAAARVRATRRRSSAGAASSSASASCDAARRARGTAPAAGRRRGPSRPRPRARASASARARSCCTSQAFDQYASVRTSPGASRSASAYSGSASAGRPWRIRFSASVTSVRRARPPRSSARRRCHSPATSSLRSRQQRAEVFVQAASSGQACERTPRELLGLVGAARARQQVDGLALGPGAVRVRRAARSAAGRRHASGRPRRSAARTCRDRDGGGCWPSESCGVARSVERQRECTEPMRNVANPAGRRAHWALALVAVIPAPREARRDRRALRTADRRRHRGRRRAREAGQVARQFADACSRGPGHRGYGRARDPRAARTDKRAAVRAAPRVGHSAPRVTAWSSPSTR